MEDSLHRPVQPKPCIKLASLLTRRQNRSSSQPPSTPPRQRSNRSQRTNRPPNQTTPAPPAHFPTPRLPPTCPLTPVPRINQAGSTEPVFPRVSIRPIRPASTEPRPARTIPRESTFYDRYAAPTHLPAAITWLEQADDHLHRIPVRPDNVQAFHPNKLYLSAVLPTRSPRSLRTFQSDCWNIYFASSQHAHDPVIIEHPIEEIDQITTSALHFQNLLWRSQIILTQTGITEEYSWIRRRLSPDHPDRAYIEPVYKISYPWTGIYWTVEHIVRLTPA